MIKITELRPPIKISGLTSLGVSFSFNQDILNVIKSFSPIYYHKKINMWELPTIFLPDLLDKLTFYDDIDLTLADKNEIQQISEPPLTAAEISEFKITPFQHQVDAVNFGLQHNKWLLLDSMGLGKTFESIALAEVLHRRGLVEKCLIICGVDSLRQNWKAEIKKFSNLPAIVLGERITRTGTVRYETLVKRAEQLKNPIDEFFVIVNITNVRDDKFIEAFKKSVNKFDMIIFDECHRATKKSQQGSNLLKLDAKYKVAMTGTLIVNSPISAYLPLAWTENDHATLTNFKSMYCEFGGFGGSQIVGYKNLETLNEEIHNCSLRRTFSQVRGDMPKKTVEYELVEMDSDHQKFYEAIKEGVKEEADKIELNTNNLLALMTRLRQATASPSVLTTQAIDSSKIVRAAEIIEDLVSSGEKIVVMSNFKEPVYELAKKVTKFQPLVCTGDQSEDSVSRNIEAFRNSTNFNVLIGTMAKIGTGFSMPECHYLVFIDQPWTQALFDQCCDRIYRITSDQPVYIKVLLCPGTVDERVREIVENKKDLSEYMIDGKPNSKFSEELKSIIKGL